jgi:hypothetical protein
VAVHPAQGVVKLDNNLCSENSKHKQGGHIAV